MDVEEFAARIEAAKNDAVELGRIADELKAIGGPEASRLMFRAFQSRLALRKAAALPSPSAVPLWLANLGLDRIDGRPLHRYHLSDRAFADLEQHLRSQVSALCNQPNGVLAAQFVLWAAEWFRRRYDGTGQRWEAVGAPLGLNSTNSDWKTFQTLTDRGLKHWRIAPLQINGTHHRLAAIARQGGFPLAAIEGQGAGWAAKFLENLVGMLLAEPLPSLDAADRIADSLMSRLVPITWRSAEIRIVSAELAIEVVRLRALAEDQGVPPGALVSAWLDQNVPDWRDELPIGVSGAAGRALVDGLMKAVVLRGCSGAISARRLLSLGPEGRREQVELKLSGVISDSTGSAISSTLADEWTRLRLFPSGPFARAVSGELATADPGEGGVWIARPSIARALFELPATVPVTTELRGGGQRVGNPFVLSGGASVPLGVRVYVAETAEEGAEPTEFLLIGHGSGSYRPECLHIDIPADWTCKPHAATATASRVEVACDAERALWAASGAIMVQSPRGDTYLVRAGQKGDQRDTLVMIGDSVPECSAPEDAVPIYVGTPRFQLCEGRTERAPTNGEIFWRVGGATSWQRHPETATIGYCEFAWRDSETGHIRDRREAIILPANFGITRKRVGDWLELSVHGWSGQIDADGAVTVDPSTFRFRAQGASRSTCTFKLKGPTEPISVVVPIPHDARIEDWSDGPVEPGRRISLSSINRYVARTRGKCVLMADLLDRDRRTVSQGTTSWWVDGELPLSAIRDDLAALLRPLGDLRATVKLNFNDGRENYWYVSEFDHQLERERRGWMPDRAVVDQDARIVGRALHDPAQERDFGPYDLLASLNHRPFELPTLHGAWLIYLRSNERVLSCPQLINGVELSNLPNTALKKAMAISDRDSRLAAIHGLLDGMFAEPASSTARELLRAVMDIAVSLDGLPPATFDVLDLICQRPLLGALMLFAAGPSELEPIYRIAEGLQFDWTLVPASDWDEAARAQAEYLFKQLPDELPIIAQIIGDRRKALTELQPALAPVLGLPAETVPLKVAANAFLNRSEDRAELGSSPFRPEFSGELADWAVGEQFWRALDAPVAAALAAKQMIELSKPQIRCIKDVSRRHPRWFRDGFVAALKEK